MSLARGLPFVITSQPVRAYVVGDAADDIARAVALAHTLHDNQLVLVAWESRCGSLKPDAHFGLEASRQLEPVQNSAAWVGDDHVAAARQAELGAGIATLRPMPHELARQGQSNLAEVEE